MAASRVAKILRGVRKARRWKWGTAVVLGRARASCWARWGETGMGGSGGKGCVFGEGVDI